MVGQPRLLYDGKTLKEVMAERFRLPERTTIPLSITTPSQGNILNRVKQWPLENWIMVALGLAVVMVVFPMIVSKRRKR